MGRGSLRVLHGGDKRDETLGEAIERRRVAHDGLAVLQPLVHDVICVVARERVAGGRVKGTGRQTEVGEGRDRLSHRGRGGSDGWDGGGVEGANIDGSTHLR